MNKQEALQKIEELKKFVEEVDKQEDWIKIDYNIIPKEVFDKYGAKPFEIMKRKMKKDGEVWNNINYFDATKEAEKLGYRLPTIQEMLTLLDWYKQKNKKVSCYDKSFLGIEELSCDENVYYEWVKVLDDVGALRGGYWDGSYSGVFALYLYGAPGYSSMFLGFRCAR